jgi:sensor histidine kinase YesM
MLLYRFSLSSEWLSSHIECFGQKRVCFKALFIYCCKMTRVERFLPIILAVLLPALNVISYNTTNDDLDFEAVFPRYIFLSTYLLSIWHFNSYLLNHRKSIVGRVSSPELFNVVMVFANLIYIALFIIVGSIILPKGVRYSPDIPLWLVIIRLILVALVLTVFQQVLRVNRQRESLQIQNLSLQAEKLKSELETMKQQVNPHFLFNSLNTLIDLIEENQTKAVGFVRTFSNLYRVVLQSSRRDFVFLEDELAFLNDYWELLKIRFKGAVVLKVDVPKDKLQALIPPLSLQLLIENAVKHNQATEQQPLVVEVYERNNALIVQNKIVLKPFVPHSEGFGLVNLQKRFSLLFEPIQYNVDDGIYRVVLPLKMN